MIAICPASTPILKNSSAATVSVFGRPISPSAAANPAPAEPPEEFVVAVDLQPPLTLTRSPTDEIGVSMLGWVKGVRYYIPQAWSREAPANTMRLVQLRIPPGEDSGLDPGTLTVSGGIGGSVYDNINRWLQQMPEASFTPQVQVIDFGPKDPLLITQLVMFGSLKGGVPGGPPDDAPDQGFFGAVVEGGPEGTIFIRATGPRAVMERNRGIWDYFLRTLRVVPKPRRPAGQ